MIVLRYMEFLLDDEEIGEPLPTTHNLTDVLRNFVKMMDAEDQSALE